MNWVVVSTTGMIVKVQDTVVIEVALPVREGSGSEVTVSGSMSAMAWMVPVEFRNMESNWVVVMFGLTSPGQQLPQFGWQPYKQYKSASAVSSHFPKGSLLLRKSVYDTMPGTASVTSREREGFLKKEH